MISFEGLFDRDRSLDVRLDPPELVEGRRVAPDRRRIVQSEGVGGIAYPLCNATMVTSIIQLYSRVLLFVLVPVLGAFSTQTKCFECGILFLFFQSRLKH